MLYFVAHLLACVWFLVLDEAASVNWMNRFGGEDDFASQLGLWDRCHVRGKRRIILNPVPARSTLRSEHHLSSGPFPVTGFGPQRKAFF
jgi:hypothetical protein